MPKSFKDREFKAVIVGGSAGSFPVFSRILASLSPDFPLPIIASMHRLKHIRHGFAEALQIKSVLPVKEAIDKEKIRPGTVYIAPANYHLMVELGGTLALSTDEMVHHSRPSLDILYESAAFAYEQKMIGIILSGANSDGAAGMTYAHRKGAYTLVQDPAECTIATMVNATIEAFTPDKIANTDNIIQLLNQL